MILYYIHIYEIINQNKSIMNSILYVIAVILIVGWAIGFFFMALGSLIHILLVIAVIALILGLIRRPTAV